MLPQSQFQFKIEDHNIKIINSSFKDTKRNKALQKIKNIARRIQEFLERNIMGGFFQDCIWRFKHIYQKEWTKTSLRSKDLLHREQFTAVIASFDNVQSVLEIGCAAGPNLRLIREKLPNVRLCGIDINKQAIKVANNYFA